MKRILLLMYVCIFRHMCFADCIPFDQASRHIGETRCVTGTVIRVQANDRGVHYLDFCEDYRLCPFSVIVFSSDLHKVGDVRELAGKLIEVRGEIKEYADRSEIILENKKQLSGRSARISPLPKGFDVEQRGHFSAGKFRGQRSRTKTKKRGVPTLPAEIPVDAEDKGGE